MNMNPDDLEADTLVTATPIFSSCNTKGADSFVPCSTIVSALPWGV